MLFTLLAAILIIIALLVVAFALRLLFRKAWFLNWLRGTVGLLMLVGSVFFIFSALDLFSYQQILDEKSVATVSFTKLNEQTYKAVLVLADEEKGKIYELSGDQWQLDARVIRWADFLGGLGMKPGYRLDRISGRYFSLHDEHERKRTIYTVQESAYGFDLWAFLRDYNRYIPWVNAVYGSATFVPMANDAVFEVTLSHTGLLARPLNQPAKEATDSWN